ncbi:unnamed protein product [Rotaria socialis]
MIRIFQPIENIFIKYPICIRATKRYRTNTIHRISVTHGHDYQDQDRDRDQKKWSRRCLGVTDPSTDVTDINIDAIDPSTDVADPSTDVTDPSTDVSDLNIDVIDPNTDAPIQAQMSPI